MDFKTEYLDAIDLRDINNKINGLMAVVASLPGVAELDASAPRAYLKGAIVDAKHDQPGYEQVPRSLYFAEAIIEMARRGQPKVD